MTVHHVLTYWLPDGVGEPPVLAPPPADPPAVAPPGTVRVAPVVSFMELPDVPPCTGTPVEGGGTVVDPLLDPLLVVGLV